VSFVLPEETVENRRLTSGKACGSCQFMWGEPGLSGLGMLLTD
jgi:hypothetical protein